MEKKPDNALLSDAARENQEAFRHMASSKETSDAEVRARAIAVIHGALRRSPEHHWPLSYYGGTTHRWWI
jgi:hypothetical protein